MLMTCFPIIESFHVPVPSSLGTAGNRHQEVLQEFHAFSTLGWFSEVGWLWKGWWSYWLVIILLNIGWWLMVAKRFILNKLKSLLKKLLIVADHTQDSLMVNHASGWWCLLMAIVMVVLNELSTVLLESRQHWTMLIWYILQWVSRNWG